MCGLTSMSIPELAGLMEELGQPKFRAKQVFEWISRGKRPQEMTNLPKGEPSANIRERVIKVSKIQEERFKGHKLIHCNAQMISALMQEYAALDAECTTVLRDAIRRLNLSARAYTVLSR